MKNGFTLVELLAVIVILAVLALIATPVVLSIIDDTKESAMLRSAEMYLSGVENAVMRENMNSGGNFRPNECTISNGTLSCNGTTVEVEVNGEVPKEGTIVFENGKIKEVTLTYESGTIVKDASGNLVYEGSSSKENTLVTICTYQNNGIAEKTAGALYSCEVKPGVSYNFYVLTTPEAGDTTINLIMDRNICEDGLPTEEGKTCLVAYNSTGDATGTGPVTAMTYLNNATSTWKNINNLNLTYDDEGENFTDFVLNGKARLPYASEIADSNGNNDYLYENLDGSKWYGKGNQPTNNISDVCGYWTLSTYIQTPTQGMCLFSDGYISWDGGSGVGSYLQGLGVRPVINLKI